ncbi:helix-turn-helix transcriptional regulator [Paraflavitalea speifideaquila]|uniref:helix-turn-helix domain-containing protein n=1 Tax=Paraflavitalea speifideaquila TaxID=3076558 RepID=UPI003312FF4C
MELQQVSYRHLLPARIKDLRKQASYTIKQVADQLGVKIGRYQHYEAGRATPDIDMLIAISHIYKLSSTSYLAVTRPGKASSNENITHCHRNAVE